jgi:polynucleotide kinase-phosphatase
MIEIPELSLVVLIGPSGSGKSTFARKHFKATEILTSDMCRALVADDENAQDATTAAFEVLHLIASKRLGAGRLTVVDATNVQPESRKPLIELARKYYSLAVAIVFDIPERVSLERNKHRTDRNVRPDVIRRQRDQMRRSMRFLKREGFRYVYTLDSEEAVEAASIERRPLWVNRRDNHGPFDIIGDIHGCFDELRMLLETLGYRVTSQCEGSDDSAFKVVPPDGRQVIFLGDLVDRGPSVPEVLRLVMSMVGSGSALCVPGNHEQKLLRALQGRNVQVTHGLAESLGQIGEQPPAFKEEIASFLDGLISHYVLDDGKLVVAHAGMRAEMQGRASGRVRDFALFGETTGETDEFGLPVRYNWAAEYRGRAMVVYGHTPVPEPTWLNGTINIDTGCVFGGKLTALRYPERELVSVPAARTYYGPAKPFLPTESPPAAGPSEFADMLEITDVFGKRIVETRLFRNVTVPEENAAAALELMSRFAIDPHWLIYLPPTMSPSETSARPGLLEHPAEAFAYYRKNGIASVVCEEKHMGSRAVTIVCRDEDAARKRFQVAGGIGAIYTRTGRPFFSDAGIEAELLRRLQVAATRAGWWDEFATDWICLDCELMPWSAKALDLLRNQYAAVGAAARVGLTASIAVLEPVAQAMPEIGELLIKSRNRAEAVDAYVDAYRRYCWPVGSVEDLRLAPFHLLASERAVHIDKDHTWHMQTLSRLTSPNDRVIMATAFRQVDVTNPASEAEAFAWWEELTCQGGEGIVVKPAPFVARSSRGLMQPAVKCRGREYLRVIYGPEYTLPENLERLRARGLGLKRSLALREFALGVEALERFARHEPLHRVHECVFGVLALESEPVDPRL